MNPLTVAFRADASLDIGTGHVMRCLTLADALRDRGALCRFICREHPGNLNDVIRQRGFDVCVLPIIPNGAADWHEDAQPAHAAWLGADWETDARQTQLGLERAPVDWLIVDHYALDSRWERMLRAACRHLMVIDDIADRPHDCDLLLDQNLGRKREHYEHLVPPHGVILAGPQYALLRPEFGALRSYSLARRASTRFGKLLITMGGVDKDNITGAVLKALTQCSLPNDCRITVVMGPHAPWLDQVRDQASRMPWPTEVLFNVRDMARLMAESDLAIGAAGSTSWERCCLGLATVLVVLADNQEAIARSLDAAGAAKRIAVASLEDELRAYFARLEASPDVLERASAAAADVTDGQGAAAIVRTLCEFRHP